MKSLSYDKVKLSNLAHHLWKDAKNASKEQRHNEAAEAYFQAADLSFRAGESLFAAKLYCLSFLSEIADDSYLKDRPNTKYLGDFESILTTENRFDMLVEGYKKIGEGLRRAGHFNLATQFYIKEMIARKNYYWQTRRGSLWLFYKLWEISSLFGESALRLLICIISLSLIQALMIMPAPIEAMETIRVVMGDYPLRSFLDYLYVSIALIFSWDWKVIQPINALGLLFICFRYLISIVFITLFVNLLVRKVSPK